MTWQGIPFKLISGEAFGTVNLALQSIPKIVIDSPTDYTSPVITAVVSLIAGIIPAGIAVWTFKRNARNTKLEREAQQKFLSRERADQQLFLKEERATQIASMEKDRETQLSIAKQNFNMQVLSVNRQEWINNLRDLLAEYMALASKLLDEKVQYIVRRDDYSMAVHQGGFNSTASQIKEKEDKSIKFNEALESFNKVRFQEKLIVSKIKMMLNPSEIWYGRLACEFDAITMVYNSFEKINMENYTGKLHELNESLTNILSISQEVLKYEWERVKQGI